MFNTTSAQFIFAIIWPIHLVHKDTHTHTHIQPDQCLLNKAEIRGHEHHFVAMRRNILEKRLHMAKVNSLNINLPKIELYSSVY